ncbi:hypothetical protein I317_00356 [Kwoniella heveanensis CBS 569]|nr:hypothetical protein I317_00356 [Kwoniella heveanensis CBS 569]
MARASAVQAVTRLDFKESLIQTGKRETTDALLKRIKTLQQKLAALEQDHIEVRSLDPVKTPLINRTILHHKDRGVRAYAACCLADLLRLYAPDAPFNQAQLRSNDASQMESQQPTIAQKITDVPYYTEYFHLIESLATIKSVVLVCDLPEADQLIQGFFTGFMEIVRPDMNKVLIRHLRDILVALIEESTSIPSIGMDCIIEQFELFSSKPDVLSFQLTVDVCNQVADKLKRPIYSHFSDIQVDHGKDSSQNDLKILSDSHKLLLTINKFCPDLLLNVVPLLQDNLKIADEVAIRQLSVKTLGRLFGQRSGAEDPARKYASAWRAWLGRRLDKALAVRLAWVEGTREVLIKHPEVRKELETNLMDRIEDSDERVRAAVCRVIGSLDYETALHHISPSTLGKIIVRMGDKKSSVRAEAATALARLWDSAYSEIESNNPDAVAQFASIPDQILRCIQFRDATPEAKLQLTAIFKSTILPLPKEGDDEQAWVDRLLLVASTLDTQTFHALRNITGLPHFAKGQSPFMAFVTSCEAYNGGLVGDGAQDIKARLNFIIDAIAPAFSDFEKAKRDLHTFAEANEVRLFKLYKTCVDVHSSLSAIVKARNEFLRRVHQSHEDLLETLTSLLNTSAWNVVNQSSIPPLLKRLQRPDSEATANAAVKLLAIIAKDGAPMFKTHTSQLAIVIMDKKNEKLVEVGYQALAAVCKVHPDVAPNEHRPVERAITVALTGTSRQAKFAARFLARSKEPEACEELVNNIVDGFSDVTDDQRLACLRALAELVLSAPKAFETKSEDIMRYVMNEVMLAPSPSSGVDGETWVDEVELEPLDRAKILGLRVLTHRCLAFARDPEADTVLKPILKLLSSVLENDGMINQNTQEGGPAACHLRLRASICLLKLANVKAFDRAIAGPGHFELVAGTIQDPSYMVRNLFLKKLSQVLPGQRLMPRWNIISVMAAMDPEPDNVILGRSILAKVVQSCAQFPQSEKVERIEMPLARLLHLLAHHPDLGWAEPGEGEEGEEGFQSEQNLKDIAKFIELYLDVVANRDNIGLLYKIAEGLKGVRDRHSDNSKPLWTLAELTQLMIRNRAEKYAWSIPIHPSHIKWPRDLFHHAENLEEKKRVQKTQYLSDEVRNWARNLGKRSVIPSAPTKRAEGASSPSKKRVKVESTRKVSKKKRRRVVDPDEDDDEDEEESDEDEEDDEEGTDTEEGDSDEIAVEEEDGEAVLGRGGRRGAKTKAQRAVGRKNKKSKSKKASAKVISKNGRGKDGDEDEEMNGESDLTDLEEED